MHCCDPAGAHRDRKMAIHAGHWWDSALVSMPVLALVSWDKRQGRKQGAVLSRTDAEKCQSHL